MTAFHPTGPIATGVAGGRCGAIANHAAGRGPGSAGLQRQFRSELDLLRDGERIVDLDPEIANGALQLGVAEQQLHSS
jgi:hypothetical protein